MAAVTAEQFLELQQRLALYEDQQKNILQELQSQVKNEVALVAGGLQELYLKTKNAVEDLSLRLEKIEAKGSGGHKERSLNNPKHIDPDKLTGENMWKAWKSDVEDYCEESMEGMKDILDEVKDHEDEIGGEDFAGEVAIWWTRRAMLWRFLKKHTEGEAKKVVQGCRGNNGWEAW